MHPNTLKLPPRRLEQLAAIANAHGLTIVDAISYMIRKEIAAGVIPPTLPGIEVDAVSDGVTITLDNGPTMTLSRDGASALAQTLRNLADRKSSGEINMDYNFSVIRRGTGIKIAVPLTATPANFTADLARDFAELVERTLA